MAFQKQVQKILTGGVNLLPPSDLIREDESEIALNWRSDQQGALKSREGMKLLVSGLGSWVHTLALVEAIPPRRYAGADTRLYRNGAVVTDGFGEVSFTGEQLGWASMDGLLWVMNPARQGKDDGGALGFLDWLPAPPVSQVGVTKIGGTLGGAVRYYVTYSTDLEHESNPSPVSEEVSDTLASFGVSLDLPTSPDPQVTKKHIYREGGMLPAPYRVATVGAFDASYTDDGSIVNGTAVPAGSTSDAEAVADGILLEFDHDPAPEGAVMAQQPYFGRLLAATSYAHPNRLWWTPAFRPWYFRGSDSELEGDWVDVGELNEEIVALSVKPRMVVIYKQHSIWRLTGDPDTGVLEQTNSDTGLVGRRAWAAAGLADYIQGDEGVYLFNGDLALKVSDRIDPVFKGLQSGTIIPVRPIDQERKPYACMTVKAGRLYFSYPEETGE